MKNKIAWLLGTLLGVSGIAYGAIVYSGYLVNNPGLAYVQRVVLDTKTDGRNNRPINTLTAQAVYSSATISAATFTDGSVASATFTVTSASGLENVYAHQTITIASTSSLKNASVTINGKKLRQGYDWFVGASTTATAASLAQKVNLLAGIDASAADGVIYATATVPGTAGNAFTITKQSAGNITLGGSTFTGGVDAAYVDIAGVRLTEGDEWEVGASTLTAANSIVLAIQADSTLNALVTASSSSAQVTITMKAVGTAGNVALATFPTSITKSGSLLTGGTDAAWALNGSNIHKANHGLTTALPVLYSTGTLAIGGLTNQTTYYAYRVDADNFKLATSTTNAVAGTGIVLTSTSTTGPHTYTLTPLAISGTFGFKWQVSDDGLNWLDMDVSSVTFATPYTAGNVGWNFGAVGYRYIAAYFNQVGTQGAMNVQISATGRDD